MLTSPLFAYRTSGAHRWTSRAKGFGGNPRTCFGNGSGRTLVALEASSEGRRRLSLLNRIGHGDPPENATRRVSATQRVADGQGERHGAFVAASTTDFAWLRAVLPAHGLVSQARI
jgi:hypothetical protein